MPSVVVDRVLRQTPHGVVFSGIAVEGGRLIVRLSERIFPFPGDVQDVSGIESVSTDERGFSHRQLDAERADRVRTSGLLLGPWVQSSHKRPDASDIELARIINETRSYITTFAEAAERVSNADDLVRTVSAKFPNFGNLFTLQYSAQSVFARRAG